MFKKIESYGIIGNLDSIALVGDDGSIDWLCLPHIDSPSVFGALLDDEIGGRFAITPADPWDSVADYREDTNILVTRFRTAGGELQVTDFMPVAEEESPPAAMPPHGLYRLLRVSRGSMRIVIRFEPRFDYGRHGAVLETVDGGVLARDPANGAKLMLSAPWPMTIDRDSALLELELADGDGGILHLAFQEQQPRRCDLGKAEQLLEQTAAFWRAWLKKSESGRTVDLGPYHAMVRRSALVLKLLYYRQTGTIAAAATTSLPEEIGGVRNWDYRFTWVRDTFFTLEALLHLGHLEELEGYLHWIEKLLTKSGVERIQVLYGLRGEEKVPEEELDHLKGYKGSRPVRIGNAAVSQLQLDIYGELMDAALKLSNYVGKIDANLWPLLRDICEFVITHWQEKDAGIWEMRGGPHHFVHSKVMCWVALDRGLTIARRYGFPADLQRWEETAAAIHAAVLAKGWNETKGAFVQHYDTDELDAANLLIPLVGFLAIDDPMVVGTMEATVQELEHNGFLYRYAGEDGLPGGEGVFPICTFWLINCLIALGRLQEAETRLNRAASIANQLGLFSEEYDVAWRESLGNFPQAFTHIGYINSVVRLRQARKEEEARQRPAPPRPAWQEWLLPRKMVLNRGEIRPEPRGRDTAARLKEAMNILRGAFFDTQHGRVAYEQMRDSLPYGEYVRLSNALRETDLDALGSREERLAFWINLYNVIIVHAVVELGIRNSVREVPRFFQRVQYRIGDFLFSPEDIEHGILRGNRRVPHTLRRRFGRGDPRRRFAIEPLEPRIHFALVCASSSCPPIGIYTAAKLDEDLDMAARAFLNGGGLIVDRQRRRVRLSRIFKWYGDDFGTNRQEVLRLLIPYLYDEEDRSYLLNNLAALRVEYQHYDWRLNRT